METFFEWNVDLLNCITSNLDHHSIGNLWLTCKSAQQCISQGGVQSLRAKFTLNQTNASLPIMLRSFTSLRELSLTSTAISFYQVAVSIHNFNWLPKTLRSLHIDTSDDFFRFIVPGSFIINQSKPIDYEFVNLNEYCPELESLSILGFQQSIVNSAASLASNLPTKLKYLKICPYVAWKIDDINLLPPSITDLSIGMVKFPGATDPPFIHFSENLIRLSIESTSTTGDDGSPFQLSSLPPNLLHLSIMRPFTYNACHWSQLPRQLQSLHIFMRFTNNAEVVSILLQSAPQLPRTLTDLNFSFHPLEDESWTEKAFEQGIYPLLPTGIKHLHITICNPLASNVSVFKNLTSLSLKSCTFEDMLYLPPSLTILIARLREKTSYSDDVNLKLERLEFPTTLTSFQIIYVTDDYPPNFISALQNAPSINTLLLDVDTPKKATAFDILQCKGPLKNVSFQAADSIDWLSSVVTKFPYLTILSFVTTKFGSQMKRSDWAPIKNLTTVEQLFVKFEEPMDPWVLAYIPKSVRILKIGELRSLTNEEFDKLPKDMTHIVIQLAGSKSELTLSSIFQQKKAQTIIVPLKTGESVEIGSPLHKEIPTSLRYMSNVMQSVRGFNDHIRSVKEKIKATWLTVKDLTPKS